MFGHRLRNATLAACTGALSKAARQTCLPSSCTIISGETFGSNCAGLRTFAGRETAAALVALVAAVTVATQAIAQTVQAQSPHEISNGRLRIAVGPANGSIVELRDLESDVNLVGDSAGFSDLWELRCTTADGALRVTPQSANRFICDLVKEAKPGLRLSWADFGPVAHDGMSVTVDVQLEETTPLSRWRIRVDTPPEVALREVRFPMVANLVRQTNESLAVPEWLGKITFDPRRVLAGSSSESTRHVWSYPGHLSMQFAAFSGQPGAGLYLACDDVAWYRKDFVWVGGTNLSVGFELVHLPESAGAESLRWTLPYNVVLGTFHGDWVAAAEQYRSWATNQAWAINSRLAQGAVPSWVLQTGLWVWNRGRSDQVLRPAVVLQADAGLPVSVFWHWWHGCAYDTGFPEYLPPREGTEKFRQALEEAHQQNLHALVYMNQRLWGMTTESWAAEQAERYAVKGQDGKVHPEVYNTFTRAPCASMCMGTEFWRSKYAGLAERAVSELGVDGIYMDQACTSLACYDPSHGHPLGGGTYWIKGFGLLVDDIRRRCGKPANNCVNPQPALAGEGCGESWLPHLDLMLSLQVSRERYADPDGWEPVPLFTAVYHPFAVTYGNYSSLTMPPYDELWPSEFAPAEPLKLLDRKFSRQFYLEQARAFVWGQQPTVANFLPSHLKERTEEMKYAVHLAKIRNRATKYLLRGVFLRPPRLRVPSAILDISRLSIYAGQRSGPRSYQKESPLALSSAWRASDGQVAIVLASIADEPLNLEVPVDRESWQLPGNLAIWRLEEDHREKLSSLQKDDSVFSFVLPPRSSAVIELETMSN
ncbi:MAG TPA: DUF6259 domain-containing protein [Verrucomicrobiota bacterium]|mgnify:CR=1 FL=1|nr:DUF6259 domain-containing protein [Verrucomicrobiota bacterium]